MILAFLLSIGGVLLHAFPYPWVRIVGCVLIGLGCIAAHEAGCRQGYGEGYEFGVEDERARQRGSVARG